MEFIEGSIETRNYTDLWPDRDFIRFCAFKN